MGDPLLRTQIIHCLVFYFVLWKDVLDKLRWVKYQVLHTVIVFFWNAQVHKTCVAARCSCYSCKMHRISCWLMLCTFSSDRWPVGEIKMDKLCYEACLFSSSHLRGTAIWPMFWQVPIQHCVTCWYCLNHCHKWFLVKHCEISFGVLEAPCGTGQVVFSVLFRILTFFAVPCVS